MRIELPSGDEFYLAMYHELCDIAKCDVLSEDDDDDYPALFMSSSSAWIEAFHSACDKLDMPELWDDYNNLSLLEIGLADDDILDRMIDVRRKELGREEVGTR